MKKVNKKAEKHFFIRTTYQAKRRTLKWKKYKKRKKQNINLIKLRKRKQEKKPYLVIPAPKNFSLIENTDEVLAYFNKAEKLTRKRENLTLDISEVDELTADTVALMVASINDPDFKHDSGIKGNAPKKPELHKLFTESGFYDHVFTAGKFAKGKENLLHKEVHRNVVPEVAKNASLTGIEHVFGKREPFEPLYEILIECMSNTNNHANLHNQGKCNWWLYVYSDPNQNITSYTFLDLGVGIFKSAVLQNYLKSTFKGTPLYKNINLVDDLLAGKIQSRIDKDKEIRGKGIPQIVDHAKLANFRSFYIIANDVKINLKNGSKTQLAHNLSGTVLYWELKS